MPKSRTVKTRKKTGINADKKTAKTSLSTTQKVVISVIVAYVAVVALMQLFGSKKQPIKPLRTPVVTEVATAVTPVSTFAPPVMALMGDLLKKAKSKTDIKNINLDQAKYLFDNGQAVFADARSAEEYAQLHIKGALSIPVNDAARGIEKNRARLGQDGKVIVAYCHGIGCHLSDKLAYALYDAGYKNVVIFFGGWNSWTAAKYPVDK